MSDEEQVLVAKLHDLEKHMAALAAKTKALEDALTELLLRPEVNHKRKASEDRWCRRHC